MKRYQEVLEKLKTKHCHAVVMPTVMEAIWLSSFHNGKVELDGRVVTFYD